MLIVVLPFFAAAAPAVAQVVSYDAFSFPEEVGWQHNEQVLQADRWIEDGWLVQEAEVVDPGPPEDPEQDTYVRSIAEFARTAAFFIEWRVQTDGPSEAIQAAAPVVLSAFGQSGVLYHFTISDDLMRFIQDVSLPIVYAELSPEQPHLFRIEIFEGDEYAWYIDGELIDSGQPEGPYPAEDSKITFRCKAGGIPTTTCWWDFVRYGVIPTTLGDFTSDGQIDSTDQFFFEECLSGPQGSWPGCAWADMDQDGDTDCADWALFQAAWTGGEPVPTWSPCDCPPDLSNDGTIGALDLALVLGAWGPNEGNAADLDADGTVGPADLAEVLGTWGPCQ